ncbi:MAG: alpha/beta hydrolase [Cyclobacteriaceae bacterium]|nr:alpha/beta hydrolase [Cyclobacteriaceae bacterium]
MKIVLSFFLSVLFYTQLLGQETISFNSSDGLEITVDLYMPHEKSAPFIVLFHQANWSRGEYIEIAPKLNAMGYNCMAVDQRSGGSANEIRNMTKAGASRAMKGTSYVDALPDVIAAIEYAKNNLTEGKLMIWGSSYSSSLVLKVAGDSPDLVDAVLAFSPGEYFSNLGKPKDWITTSAKQISIPVFITSSRNEKMNWWKIYESIPSVNKHYFLPTTSGNHGARALWEKFSDSKDYWTAIDEFLDSI